MELLKFFFEPVILDLELADLPVQLLFQSISFFLASTGAVGKDARQRFKRFIPPLPDLVRMNAEFTRQLGKSLFPLDGF
jgi:hypothetical protein